MIIITRITKIQTSSLTCVAAAGTASKMNVISATPVTPYVSKPSALGPTAAPALSHARRPGASRCARIVARAVRNHAWIARIVFLDVENDLHQVGTDVCNLREDAARDAQRRGAKRFSNGKTDEARTGVITRDEEENEQHDQQLDADQHHADAHAGTERNGVDRICLALETRECGA